MLTAKTPQKQAQKIKQFLLKNNLFNKEYAPQKQGAFIHFPLLPLKTIQIKKLEKKLKLKIINKTLKRIPKPKTQLQLLKNHLTNAQLQLIPHTQEIVGNILVLEIPQKLKPKEKIIAQSFLETNPRLKTVVKKEVIHSGEYRLRKVKILAGKRTKETIHLENNTRLKINLEKTYFSTRLANERLRIAKQIKKPETVLVMFSGAAPYPLTLAKNSKAKFIYGIEINPQAHKLALENLKLNKINHRIKLFQGDVRKVLPKIKKKFNRILMPLPKTGEQFLPLALKKTKPNATIHLYAFLEENQLLQEIKKIKQLCQHPHKIRILRKVKCGQFSPSISRYCFDLKLLK